ncbi:hypothetical protein [Hymenobacter lapidiphilus]|uniref:LemA family protein n=1 Tax=Hymenobacter lapidiphilus TaxID=2608003 RepID=A0A7Y7PNY6_9BACT|nr:hypothetical protein [Hymenobacter lapidiphilus]NVO31187.1 hypothetical protein [Hymenobacter lapidiphilus]
MMRFVALLLALGLLMTSCNRTPAPIDPASVQAVKVQLNILRDTVAARWSEMQLSDDDKQRNTKQLLRELSGLPGTDRVVLARLQYANDRLPARRYTQQSMADSDLIDAYDTAQDSLLRAVYGLVPVPTSPTVEATPVLMLTGQIQEADAELVGFRTRYDQAAMRFNNYLQLHQNELRQLGGKYADLQPLPLFTLQN